jgi:hypothetical protein
MVFLFKVEQSAGGNGNNQFVLQREGHGAVACVVEKRLMVASEPLSAEQDRPG